MSDESFTPEQQQVLKSRYVLDRVDGRPILTGHARCPECEVHLRPEPKGRMDLGEKLVRCTVSLQCPACGRKLSLSQEFEWGP